MRSAKAPSSEVERARAFLAGLGVAGESSEPRSLPCASVDVKRSLQDEGLTDDRAFSRIVTWVNVRDRSVQEVRERLAKEGFDFKAVDRAVARAARLGLLDDHRFTEVFVRSKVRAGWGHRKIEQALYRFGIDPTLVLDDYPDAYGMGEDDFDRALDLAQKKFSAHGCSFDKCMRFLVSRGFDGDVACRVARILGNQREDLNM